LHAETGVACSSRNGNCGESRGEEELSGETQREAHGRRFCCGNVVCRCCILNGTEAFKLWRFKICLLSTGKICKHIIKQAHKGLEIFEQYLPLIRIVIYKTDAVICANGDRRCIPTCLYVQNHLCVRRMSLRWLGPLCMWIDSGLSMPIFGAYYTQHRKCVADRPKENWCPQSQATKGSRPYGLDIPATYLPWSKEWGHKSWLSMSGHQQSHVSCSARFHVEVNVCRSIWNLNSTSCSAALFMHPTWN
jgi:hypothetical protein